MFQKPKLFGFAEIILPLIWRSLPQSIRRVWGARLHLWQLRGLIEVPESVVVPSEVPTSGAEPTLSSYSLLCTVRNEGKSIEAFLDSVLNQTHKPLELIIVDGGSQDNTVELIQTWQTSKQALPFSLQTFVESGANIARGRNIAAERAKSEILAFADAGCELDKRWAAYLLRPFATDNTCEMSMGFYRAVCNSAFARAVSEYILPRREAIRPETFLPSARSLAVKKDVFFRVGGFPEFLSRAGEDTLFGYYMKFVSDRFAFVPEAISLWRIPCSTGELFRTIAGYAQGDAEGGKTFWAYYLKLLGTQAKIAFELLLALLLWSFARLTATPFLYWLCLAVFLSAIVRLFGLIVRYLPLGQLENPAQYLARINAVLILTLAQGCGFLRGLFQRPAVEKRRVFSGTSGHVVLLAPYLPIGSEVFCCNTPLELELRQLFETRHYVTLIYQTTAQPMKDKRPRIQHPLLETHQRSAFVFAEWADKHRPLLKIEGRVFSCKDLVKDSWSAAMVGTFVNIGAEAES